MADYVKITPLTRLEGHLGITARVSDETPYYVSSAYSHGEMFRGLEKILLGRDPRDAPIITSRTCGVCHFIHRHCSLRNIETAAGFVFPFAQAGDASYSSGVSGSAIDSGSLPGYLYSDTRWHGYGRDIYRESGLPSGADKMPVGAQLARNIVHAVTYVYSHAAHTIALAAPDYKGWIDKFVQDANDGNLSSPWDGFVSTANAYIDSSDLTSNDGSFFDNFYNEAVVAQRILHEILGFLGGKVPHQQSAIPGGFSRSFEGALDVDNLTTAGTDMNAIALLANKYIGLGGAEPSGASGDKGTQYFPLIDIVGVTSGTAGTILDSQSNLGNTDDDGWLVRRASLFTVALAYACSADEGQTAAVLWGRGSDNFVCAGTFDIIDDAPSITGDQYFRAGVKLSNGNWYGLDPTTGTPRDSDEPGSGWRTIYEDITSGKYPEPDKATGRPVCGGYPGDSETQPATYTHGLGDRYTYTWYKATRAFDGEKTFTVESGPFARLVVNGCDPDLNLTGDPDVGLREYLYDYHGSLVSGVSSDYAWLSTTANRLLGRVQDMLLIIDMMFGTDYSGENKSSDAGDGSDGYLKEIRDNTSWLTRLHTILTSYSPIPSDLLVLDKDWENFEGEGADFWDAPRGITCHFSKVENGLLTQYQHIAGTTWNGNGRDAWGNPGPFEWSLMGVAKEDTEYTLYGDPDVEINDDNLSSGKVVITLNNAGDTSPVVERTLKIKYKLAGTQYEAYDKPKTGVDENEGQIVGVGLKSTSKVVYDGSDSGSTESTAGKVVLEFKPDTRYPDYSHVSDIEVVRFCYVANANPSNLPVPANAVWADSAGTDAYNWGYDAQGSETNDGKPNPINVLRTIRSYDPCLACSIHVVDKEGREGKYEAVPMAGWDPK